MQAAGARGNPGRSRALEAWLRSIAGVQDAAVNPLTGNALILYEPAVVEGAALIQQMRERQWIGFSQERDSQRVGMNPAQLRAGVQRTFSERLIELGAQLIVERAVAAVLTSVL